MRTSQPDSRHPDAMDRRLAQLGDELAWLRPDPPSPAADQSRPGSPGGRAAPPAVPWWDEHTRIARSTAASGDPWSATVADRAVDLSGGGPQVPAPGRHAARRPTALVERTPAPHDGWPPRPGSADRPGLAAVRLLLGPAQLTVIAVVVVFALGITCWWLARGRPDTMVALQAAPASGLTAAPSDAAAEAVVASSPTTVSPAGSGGASTGASPAASGAVTVDVAGKVRRPGVQVLPAGSRIIDAVTAAGGARPGVDLTALNLAQVVADGQQIVVGATAGTASGSAAPAAGSTSSAAAPGAVQVVDLNTATADQLDTLPDVGPVTAQSILAWRDAHGGFSSVDELLEVDGIGQVTLGKLAPYVTV